MSLRYKAIQRGNKDSQANVGHLVNNVGVHTVLGAPVMKQVSRKNIMFHHNATNLWGSTPSSALGPV